MSFRFLPCRRKTGWLLRDWGCVVTSTTGAASLSKDTVRSGEYLLVAEIIVIVGVVVGLPGK